MKQITWICDRCKKPYKPDSEIPDYTISVAGNVDLDLCQDCKKELELWMREGVKKS